MKNMIIVFIAIAAYGSGFVINIKAQNKNIVVTQTIQVRGNCGQCKDRIESAVDVKGVKYCKWDRKTQVLTVTYKPSVITIEDIIKNVLKVGHDVDTLRASDSIYNNLPDCCKYRHVKPH